MPADTDTPLHLPQPRFPFILPTGSRGAMCASAKRLHSASASVATSPRSD